MTQPSSRTVARALHATGPAITRRDFLASGAAVAVNAAVLASQRATAADLPCTTLIFVLLRGGADGMSMLVPHADPRYVRLRALTAIAAPGGGPDCTLDLDGFFGLHPRLAPFAAWFAQGDLCAWPATGWSNLERSHAAAERRLWHAVQRIVGPRRVLRLDERLRGTGGFPLHEQLRHAGQLIEQSRAPSVVWTQCSGWDTHVAQGAAQSGGRLADRLDYLAQALASTRRRLAEQGRHATFAVMSEFGRSPLENRQAGTDDGHASALFLIGRGLGGKRIAGEWPELRRADALPPTADLAQLLPELIESYATCGRAAETVP